MFTKIVWEQIRMLDVSKIQVGDIKSSGESTALLRDRSLIDFDSLGTTMIGQFPSVLLDR